MKDTTFGDIFKETRGGNRMYLRFSSFPTQYLCETPGLGGKEKLRKGRKERMGRKIEMMMMDGAEGKGGRTRRAEHY